MDHAGLYVTRPLGLDEARELVLKFEHSGVASSNISVTSAQPHDSAKTGRVDEATVSCPLDRVVTGALMGVGIGVVLSLTLTAISTGPTAPAVVLAIVVGAIVGGLLGLYWRLPMTPGQADADTGGLSVVLVDLTGLNDSQADRVVQLLQQV